VAAFNIMTYQVSHADYQGCVTSGACTDTTGPRPASQPQTNVNWMDAVAFAHWLSAETGETWRLPTAAEWQLAAADRYGDASADTDDLDPGQRMLAQYERGTLLRGRVNTSLRPSGGFGKNSLGVADMAGNVWEWTNDCSENGTLDADGNLKTTEPYCGVRVAGGIHRAVVIDFVRDASVGGCAVGLPPDFLGVRLVRDD
jgi:formylglycine-generating enzyme required for sulfatase activity